MYTLRHMTRTFKLVALSNVLGVFLGVLLGFSYWKHPDTIAKQVTQVRGGGSKYTNPLLECDLAQGSIDSPKTNFSEKLKEQIDSLVEEHKLSSMGVYFRDLNNGPGFGINANEGYFPASLLKLPVSMAFYKIEETNPSILDQKILFSAKFFPPEIGDKQYIPPESEIEVGKEYSIRELIWRSLVHSDNQAVTLLYEKLNATKPQTLRGLYRLLGVDESVLNGPNATLSVQQYSSFLRILFNASYLSIPHSEEILSILAASDFKDGLVAKLPENIVVAHKFGESGYQDGDRQLHDCGIIYYPKHPYLLCVMSRGEKLGDLKSSIAKISRFVFDQIDEQYSQEK